MMVSEGQVPPRVEAGVPVRRATGPALSVQLHVMGTAGEVRLKGLGWLQDRVLRVTKAGTMSWVFQMVGVFSLMLLSRPGKPGRERGTLHA